MALTQQQKKKKKDNSKIALTQKKKKREFEEFTKYSERFFDLSNLSLIDGWSKSLEGVPSFPIHKK